MSAPTAADKLPEKPHPLATHVAAEGAKVAESLKATTANEKNTLPDADDIAQEKREVDLRKSIEQNDKRRSLSHVDPVEKTVLPSADDVKKEKQEQDLRKQIETGHRLSHVETQVKNPLPDKKAIAEEKKAGK